MNQNELCVQVKFNNVIRIIVGICAFFFIGLFSLMIATSENIVLSNVIFLGLIAFFSSLLFLFCLNWNIKIDKKGILYTSTLKRTHFILYTDIFYVYYNDNRIIMKTNKKKYLLEPNVKNINILLNTLIDNKVAVINK